MRKIRRKRSGDGTGRTAAGETCEGQRRAPSFKEDAKRGHGIVFRTSLCANAEICGGAYSRKSFLPCPSFMRACGAHRGAARVIGRHLISGRSAFAALPRPAATLLSRTLLAGLPRASVPRNLPRAVSPALLLYPCCTSAAFRSNMPHLCRIPPLSRLLHRTPSADGIKTFGSLSRISKNIVVIFKDMLYNNI